MQSNGLSWFRRLWWMPAVLLIVGGMYALYVWLPADGTTGDLESFSPLGFRVQWVLEEREGGLEPGDLIVRAGGYTVDEWLAGAPRGPEWRTGGVVPYQVLRRGTLTTVDVRLAPVPPGAILARWAPQLLVALALLLIGAYVAWKRPQELSARLMMLFCVAVALQYWGDAYNFQFSTVPWRWPLWLQVAYEHGIYSLSVATVCYFALVFPVVHPVARRFPRLVPFSLYGSHFVAILGAMVLTPGYSAALEMGSRASWVMAMIQIGLAIVIGARSVRVGRDPVARAQIRWILWSATVGVTVLFPTYVVPLILGRRPLLPHPVIMIVIALVPFTVAIAILRYHLFDIELIINRSLVYGVLTALLGGLYLALVRLLTLAVQWILRRENDTLVVFMATLGIALAFTPLRRRVQIWIDRVFYRVKVDYQALLSEMSERLATSIVPDQLASLLTQELPRRLQVDWAALAVHGPAGEHLVPAHGEAFLALPADDALVEYLGSRGRSLLRLQPPPDLPLQAMSWLERHNVELIIPLIVGREMVGVYALGPKLSGAGYSPYDTRLLRILGQEAAISVQNARLYQQVQDYSRTLEDQVRQRTHELQHAYRDLAQQHATLNVVLDNMADGLVVTDLEERIMLVNPVFARIIDSAPRDLAGRKLSEVLPCQPLGSAVTQALQAPPAIVTVDAAWASRVYRASACALVGKDRPASGVVTVLRDITKEVEIARMKDDFVSMVSHELRTPLTAIMGFVQLIRRQLGDALEADDGPDGAGMREPVRLALGDLGIISSQGERLRNLINNVLDLSRMETSQLQWEMGRVDLAEVIESSAAGTESLAWDKGIPVHVEVGEDLPAVYGDRDRLIQVVTNLLSNAIKFTDRGEIQVRAWRLVPGEPVAAFGICQPGVDLEWPDDGSFVAVSVTDTGTGIATEDLPHVFERFRQVGDRARGTRRSGTGLGLTIAKEIVEHHGGRIWAESQLEKGSRFTFILPVRSVGDVESAHGPVERGQI